MIVRPDGDSWLLVRQEDHAALAADLLSHWQADGVPDRPTRATLLDATRLHDCGWLDEDDRPSVDPALGAPWDFVHLPISRRQAVWLRAMTRLDDRPHIAALVAHHALTAYNRFERDPAWGGFFRTMASERDRRVSALAQDGRSGVAFDSFLRDYALLRLADLVSLTLCHGWSDAFEVDYYRAVPDGATLTLTPDPFGGAIVPWRVAARRIPRRHYASDTDLRDTVDAAPVDWLDGFLQGLAVPLPS